MNESPNLFETPQPQRPPDRWHVGKEIPLIVIIAAITQTLGGAWWLSTLSGKVDSTLVAMNEYKLERYTKDDSRRDREYLMLALENMRNKDVELDRRINETSIRVTACEEAQSRSRGLRGVQ